MSEISMDMTTGSIGKKLLFFSLPLVFTNIIQILFNMADIAVAGRFAGSAALGAVGSTPFLVFIFTWLLVGLGNGINVIVAYYLGKKAEGELGETVHTAFLFSLIFGILLSVFGFAFAGDFLTMMNTKSELLSDAVLYFRIYILAIPAVAVYNFGNGVLSACGDTKSPFLILLIAGIINIALNLCFVILLELGVRGVALATDISLYASAVMILIPLIKGKNKIRLRLSHMRITVPKLVRICKIGIPAGLQGAIFAVANVFVQIGVNTFDAATVAGVAASANADQLIYDVMAAFYAGCATFIGQNYGANRKDRIVKTYWWALLYSFVAGLLLGLSLYAFGKEYLSLFTTEDAVIAGGLHRIKIMAFSYCVSAFMDNTIAACRGLGKTLIPSVVVFLGSCVFRISWIYTVFAYFKTIESLYLLFVFSWALTAVLEIIYFAVEFKKTFPARV